MVGHCAVRFYVMGERAVEEQASDDERKQMADVVAHSIDRGAVGFSTNRYPPHKLPDGRSIPRYVRGGGRTGRDREGRSDRATP